MIDIRAYISADEKNAFAKWFKSLNFQAAAKVNTYVSRMEAVIFHGVEGVGGGVFECRIDFGPGYRVYFGKDGEKIIILLGGGTKKRQSQDIAQAKRLWQEYKQNKGGVITWH